MHKIDISSSVMSSADAALLASFGLNYTQFVTLAILMCIDFATGIAKAYRLDRNSVSSYEMRIGVVSKVLYLIIPIVLSLCFAGIGLINQGEWIVSFAMYALILSETYSIVSNIYTFKTKKETEEIDAVSYILKAIKRQIERVLESR